MHQNTESLPQAEVGIVKAQVLWSLTIEALNFLGFGGAGLHPQSLYIDQIFNTHRLLREVIL